jgi:membrane protein YqaA with SNARE-associated domain
MGVRVRDRVSFAVALSNMINNNNKEEKNNLYLAKKVIKRLEAVGMRTIFFSARLPIPDPLGWSSAGAGVVVQLIMLLVKVGLAMRLMLLVH